MSPAAAAPAILNVHTPSSSFSIVHSFTQESLHSLYDALSRKSYTSYYGERVGPGWLKYEFNDSIWNLDDDSDYTIFVWRQHQPAAAATPTFTPSATTDSNTSHPSPAHTPTLHLHNPAAPLPGPDEYHNTSYYLYRPNAHRSSPAPSIHSRRSQRTKGSRRASSINGRRDEDDGIPKHKKDFEKFHSENGVRTVMGSIGPVQNVRMLLRAGYRHVYISRKFAIKHGFIPKDAALGHYGYGGLVNIGTWPITLKPSSSMSSHPDAPAQSHAAPPDPQPTLIGVFLAEEPHFDVVLGRSFFEKRQIRFTSTDPTDVVCLDTGEKIESCFKRDGRVFTRNSSERGKRQVFSEAGRTGMHINPYAVIAGLAGILLIVTKMRHPHIKHVRESLEGSVLFRVINALDFYTGNHDFFYNEPFPQFHPSNRTSSRDPFQSSVPSICPCAQLSSPDVDSHSLPKKLPGADAYQILPALCAIVGIFFSSVAIYLRKSLRHALLKNQRNVVVHTMQVERRASKSQEAIVCFPTPNANVSQEALFPPSSVSVVTRRNDPIFYPNAGSVVVAPPMPIAISDPLLQTDPLPESLTWPFQSQNRLATPLATDSPPPSTMPSITGAPVIQIDGDLPCSIPLPQDEPDLVTARESSGVSIHLSSPIKPDVAAVSCFTSLRFPQNLDAQRSTAQTPALSSDVSTGSPRNPLHTPEPATPSRPNSTPRVSCRRPDWLSSAQYSEAHSRLNVLVSNTAASIETTPGSDATRIEALGVSPADYKIRVPRVRATVSLAQSTTVSGSASWEHLEASTGAPAEAHFVTGHTGADLVFAMSTDMPRVTDMGVMSRDGSRWDNGREWVGASGSASSLAEMSVSPRASSILRRVAAAAAANAAQAPSRSSRRKSNVTATVLQTPWLNRTGAHNSGGGTPVTATATRCTGISPIQTAAQTGVMRRVLGPHRGSSAGHPSERWTSLTDSVERPPVRITRVFGERAAA